MLRAGLAAWVVAFMLGASLHTAGATPPAFVTGKYLLTVREGADPAEAENEVARLGGRVVDRIDQVRMFVVDLPPGAAHAAQAALEHSARFELVEPEEIHEPTFVPNDPLLPNEWHLSKIQAFGAWDLVQGGSAPIAILDSGVDPTHPDLAGKLVPGWNCYDNNADTSDVYGHGTKVAGSAAAAGNNSVGVAGLALTNPIMPVRVTGTNGWAGDSAIVKGLTWAADHGARVANLSFAGIETASSILTAAQYFVSKGGLVTASAGNYATDDGAPDTPYVVSVSATGGDDALASWSSFGRYVDVAAPGVGIYTTVSGGGWGSASGTSFSAPVTAGVIGLVFGAKPTLTPQQAESILESNADDLGTAGFDVYYGWGRVNALRAVTAALASSAPPPDATAPTASISAPSSGSTLTGNTVISATATDNVGVKEVRFYVDGQMVASDSASPFGVAWNTTTSGDGGHTVTADAYDAAGNRGSAAPVSVTVSNASALDTTAPTASVASPSAGATVSGLTTLAVSASDNVGVTEVRFYVDGWQVGTDSTAPYQISWNSAGVPDGMHAITADAFDGVGNWGTTAPVSITVSNAPDTTPPSVSISASSVGASVSTKQGFTATASDTSGIARVEFLVDGVLKSTDTTAPWTFSVMTKKWTVGTHTVSARAVDGAGISATASITVMKTQAVKGGKKK